MELNESQQRLIQQLSQTIGKIKVLELTAILKNRELAVADLVAVTFYPKYEIAFRAAWILENLFLSNPSAYVNDIDSIITASLQVKNESCLRHYLKLLVYLTGKKAAEPLRQKIAIMDMEPVISRCFDLLIDEASPIALKVFAMELLCNLRHREDWITETLIGQVQILMEDGGPAIRSGGRNVLRKLLR
jgi:hypothetical protein